MRAISSVFTRIAERYLPDAFVFVFVLTALTFVLGMLQGYGPTQVALFWGGGFFDILTFTAQATLVLATGFALAHTPVIHAGLEAFARIPKNEVQVIVLTTLVMMVCSWLSWGFGLVAGAIVARQMGIVHRDKIHYPLVVAATYSGFLIWHGGYSGAIPTLIATPGHFLEEQMGVIPVSETIFAGYNFLIILALAVVVPIANLLMRPRKGEERRSVPAAVYALEKETGTEPDAELAEMNPEAASAPAHQPVTKTPADWIETSRFVTLALGLLGALYMARYFFDGGPITLNTVIVTFFVLGLLLVRRQRPWDRSG